MAAAPRPVFGGPAPRGPAALTELKVTGWTDVKDVPEIVKFLERHALKRSQNVPRGRGATPVQESHVQGNALILSVRPEFVVPFSKINGFSFTSPTHGAAQKLTIEGEGIRARRDDGSPAQPSITTNNNATGSETETLQAMLTSFLTRRYNTDQKLLNLSAMAEDPELAQLGLFTSIERQKKLFPVLTTILEKSFESPEAKRDAIHSVSLSNNGLADIELVKSLAWTLPQIKNLDLAGNNITSTKGLGSWKVKFRDLEHIIVTNNPLATAEPGYEQTLMSWFPKLRFINTIEVRSLVETLTKDQQTMINVVQKFTNLNMTLTIECCQFADWDYEKAADLWVQQRGNLGPEAYVSST
ncbi:hypothetical protein EJ04DRAFT_515433 [Polyplosphaeria fusca]|uniref:TAP-C domain-containing protein n=1 Tax=Polyplosphaeria fusca TaxID=682080 RepID=A0A9P4QSL1_9PLEO|nr:hypothetical protein EJ04DRAFT_515433 [Polyplosphaeria fusca]